jgi:hypothetical protein
MNLQNQWGRYPTELRTKQCKNLRRTLQYNIARKFHKPQTRNVYNYSITCIFESWQVSLMVTECAKGKWQQ